MKKIYSILITTITVIVFFGIGRWIGFWYAELLKGSGGMVTASEMIGCKWGIPIGLSVVAGYIAYRLTNDD